MFLGMNRSNAINSVPIFPSQRSTFHFTEQDGMSRLCSLPGEIFHQIGNLSIFMKRIFLPERFYKNLGPFGAMTNDHNSFAANLTTPKIALRGQCPLYLTIFQHYSSLRLKFV